MGNKTHILAAGEEDLVAFYLGKLNKQNEHDFVLPKNYDVIFLEEGYWEDFASSIQRRKQVEANEISYTWDRLIEEFNYHLLTDTQYFKADREVRDLEKAHRFLARENRFKRRILSEIFVRLLEKTPINYKAASVVPPFKVGDPYFVFLLVPTIHAKSELEYREVRRLLLLDYCRGVKLKYPDAKDIVGIATEPDISRDSRSEDLIYYDAREWTLDDEQETKRLRDEIGILKDLTLSRAKVKEYPDKPFEVKAVKEKSKKLGRNDPCSCGSGKKYKYCCMRNSRQVT